MTTRRDLYQEVTDKIIADLEGGIFPWLRPWTRYSGAGDCAGMPRNLATGKRYSGVNVLLLWSAAASQGFESNDWLTFKQAQKMGAQVRKGSKGTTVVYADRFVPKREREKAPEDQRAVFFLKAYTVFNRAQVDGLPDLPPAPAPRPTDDGWHPDVRDIVANSGVELRIGGDRACYAPGPDMVLMPPLAAFTTPDDFASTLLHELGHWTGHKSRLDRDHSGGFGSAAYAREELVAEMTAAFSAAALGGIEPTVRHADYIGNWLELLRSDNKAVVRAASAASRASDYLLAYAAPAERDDTDARDGTDASDDTSASDATPAYEPGAEGYPQGVVPGIEPHPAPAHAAQLALF